MWHDQGPSTRDFFQAAILGEEDGILAYLKDGCDVNLMYENDEVGKNVSALMMASENGHMECVRTLLNSDADISHLSQLYTKAVVYASQQGLSEILTTLAVAGMCGGSEPEENVMVRYKQLTDCARGGDVEKVLQLLSDSTLSEHIDDGGLWVSVLCLLIMAGCSKTCVEGVVKSFNIDIVGFNCRGFTPLISSIVVGNLEAMDYLIEKGANINKTEDLMRHSEDIECRWVNDLVTFSDNSDIGNNGEVYFPFSTTLDSDSKSPIMFAVWTGKLDIVKQLLATDGLNTSCSDSQGRTVLVHAVYAGCLDIVNELLSHGVDVDEKHSKTGRTILFDAVSAGRQNVLEKIFEAVGDKTTGDKSGKTALSYAAEIGKINCLKFLLDSKEYNVNSVDLDHPHYTPLMYASRYKHYDCLKLLIDYGASVALKTINGETVLSVAADYGDVRCMKFLIEENQKLMGVDLESEQRVAAALNWAARNKDVEVLKLVLPHCKNVDAIDADLYTALMCAASEGQTDAMEVLLDRGADVNCVNEDGETALWVALKEEEMSSFEFLIDSGADVKCAHEKCETFLVLAAQMENTEFLEILLQKGAPVNEVCKCSKCTPLTAAISNGKMENVRMLLKNGADVNLCDGRWNTPAMCAARWLEVLQLLMESGVDLNSATEDEETVWFSVTQSSECLKMVLENGTMFEDNENNSNCGNNNNNNGNGLPPRRLKLVHRNSPLCWNHQWDVRSLLLLFEYGVFEWDWFVYGGQHEEVHKFAFAAVNVANGYPLVFPKEDQEGNVKRTSLLQEAFLAIKPETVRYLLANLFFTIEDYRVLVSDSSFRAKVEAKEDWMGEEGEEEEEEDSNKIETVALLHRFTSQPWRLETLSFLVISSCLTSSSLSTSSSSSSSSSWSSSSSSSTLLSSSSSPSITTPCQSHNQQISRSQHVDSLALPEILKSKLRFETAVRKLCPSEWTSVGKLVGPRGEEGKEEEDILAVFKPLYPREENLTDCDEECRYCYGCGLSIEED